MKKILITGGAGTVGSSFINEYYNNYIFYNVSRNETQITKLKQKFPNGTPVHDAFVTADLVDSTLTTGEITNVEVEVDSQLTLGQTVVDINNISGRNKNVHWMN